MTDLREGNVVWSFDTGYDASQYDDWAYYRNGFDACAGSSKAVDFVVLSQDNNDLWLIEAKDYRRSRRTKTTSLHEEIATKARDTLAGLLAARVRAVGKERAFARRTTRTGRIRVVLHLELPTKPSKGLGTPFDPADVRQKLKQLLRRIDPHPIVESTTTQHGKTPWTTRWDPVKTP